MTAYIDINNNLISEKYNESYFTKEFALEESTYVYIKANELEKKFSELRGNFIISEAGFGSGLNFINTFSLWLTFFKAGKPNKISLQYIAYENNILSSKVIDQYFERIELNKKINPGLINEFLQAYKEEYKKIYLNNVNEINIIFHRYNVSLKVIIGDICETIHSYSCDADVWFLDGFSPKKNPRMWSTELFASISNRIKPTGSLSTYSSAGVVKKGLRENQFFVKRKKGFMGKHHMLVAYPIRRKNL